MTAEEVGIYIRLLCHAWNKKGLKNDEKRLGILVGICGGNAMASAKEVLASKFELGEDGIWRNARQEKTRAEQEEYRKTQSNNAHLRWDRVKASQPIPKTNGSANGYAMALPPECSPSPSPTPLKERESGPALERHFPEAVIPTWSEVKKMAEMSGIPETVAQEFFAHYEANNMWTNKHGLPVNVRGSLTVWFNRGQKMNRNGDNKSAGKPAKRELWQLLQDEKAISTRLNAERESVKPKPDLIESLKVELRGVRAQMTELNAPRK